jgi:pilus assembly protein FimV
MHLRKLTFTVGLVGALCSTWAYGLGLGEIKLNSTLNQPLDAEIKLLQVRNLTEEDILVSLARAEDFQRFGVDRIFFLQNLQFDVQLNHPEGPLVRVTTREPVREPYLIFLLEAESPSGGRLLREYTLLLDLPVFADAPAEPVQGAQTRPAQTPAPVSRPAPAPAASQPQAAQPRAGEPPRAQPAPERSVTSRPGVEVYGPVQPNDTLWEIAERVRPSNSVSVQQSMLALQRANPEAFIDGNINLLKRGQVLRIPSENEWGAVDRVAAVSEVASQNERWSAARSGQPTGAELQASSSRPLAANQSETPRGQLTIAAPGVTDSAGERSGAGDTSANVEGLENELAITSEQLDATRRENQELSTRVAELEAQIATMERLIEVSNEELRAMQLAAEQGQAAENTAAAPPASDTINEPVQPAAAEPVAADSAPQPEPVVVPQTIPQPTIIDQVMANLWYLLGGLFAVIGAVALFLQRRRQKEEEEAFESAVEEDLFADPESEFDNEVEAFHQAEFDESVDLGDEESAAFEEAPEPESVEAETGDVVGEADIYIAYGKYDQAEEMLQKAIAREPENVDARLKLLEVYSETHNVDKFDREYALLMGLGIASATARAAELRGAIPGVEQYESPVGIAQTDSASGSNEDSQAFNLSDDDFNFDSDDSDLSLDDEEPGIAARADGQDGDDESVFGDLTLDLDEADGKREDKGFNLDLSGDSLDIDKDDFDFALDTEGDELQSDDPKGERPGAGALELDGDDADEMTLDIADASETTSKAGDDFDFSAFELDSDEGSSAKSEDVEAGLEFGLDLNGPSLLDAEVGVDSDTDSDALPDLDLAGLELEKSEEESDDLDLDLGEDFKLDSVGAGATGTNLQEETEDDVFSDREFSAAAADEKDAEIEFSADDMDDMDELDNLEFASDLNSHRAEANADVGDADESDDFDLDMGDLDLEALDQEMDALVGEVDDLGDDDVAVATPTETLTAVDETQVAAAAPAEEEFDLDFAAEDLDGEEWSLEEVAPVAERQMAAEPDAFAFGEDQSFEDEESDDLDSELDFLSDADEVATKLDLARAYIDMGDQDGARDILDEVRNEGSEEQKREAAELLERIV